MSKLHGDCDIFISALSFNPLWQILFLTLITCRLDDALVQVTSSFI